MNKVPESIAKELAALLAKPEEEIDFSDIPATTDDDWKGAVRGKFYRPWNVLSGIGVSSRYRGQF